MNHRLRNREGFSGNGNGHANGNARPPRVLILSASVGTGHMRAAEAVEVALRQTHPDAFVQNVDVLDLSSAPFRRCYGGMYVDFIDAAPSVLGYFYNLMDRPRPPGWVNHWDHLRLFLEKANLRPFLRFLGTGAWDVIINTHFLPSEIIASLRCQDRFHTPQVMVTTDFETHHLWVNQPCEHYFTATDEAAQYLEFFGVPHPDTSVVGIPIHPVFSEPKSRDECLRRQGLRGDRPIILQLAGGFGVGPIEDLYRAILDVSVPSEIVVVTGRNAKAKEQLQTVPVPPRHRVKVLGYTHDMDELLTVADLVVSKPGGLTISETMAKGAGLVIVNPVPGQEERNSDYLLENGAAVKVNHIPTLAHKVSAVLRDPERLARLKAHSKRLGRPRAALDVVEISLGLLPRLTLAPDGSRQLQEIGS
jgi:processive 1,2-diacylglycerol beta-glucosyltransferase